MVLPFILPWFSMQIAYKTLIPLKLLEQTYYHTYCFILSLKLLSFKDTDVYL